MEHIQDVYIKKPEMIEKIFDHLTKVNLKVDGKPFQVLYNEETDELEYHGRSGNETKVGPMIDDMYMLFSKPINDAIRHIEARKEVFKKYKFLTFEVISEVLLLTSIITKDGEFIDDPDKIDSIAEELETDVMPCLWKGKISAEQKHTLMEAISTNVIPTKDEFVKWVKALFGTYDKFPKTLISRSSEYIEGIVFFYNVDGKIVEYKLVDPTFRQSVKDNQANMKADNEANADKYRQIYEIFVDWAKDNASKLDNSRMKSIELNFIEMMEDPKRYNKLMSLATGLTTITTDAYFLQPDRISDELKKAIQKHGKVYQLLYEKFVRLFWKAKKRNFTISKEFQQDVNKICGMVGESLIFEKDDKKTKDLLHSKEDLIKYIKTLDENYSKKFINKLLNYANTKISHYNAKITGTSDIIETWIIKKVNENPDKHSKNCNNAIYNVIEKYACYDVFADIAQHQLEMDKTWGFSYNDLSKKDSLGNKILTIDEIAEKYNKLLDKDTKEIWIELLNITVSPQPDMGKGELLLKVISNIDKNASTNGDFQMDSLSFELKNLSGDGARIGSSTAALSYPTFNIFKITDYNSLTKDAFKDVIEIYNGMSDGLTSKIIKNGYDKKYIPRIEEKILNDISDELAKKLNEILKSSNPSIDDFKKAWMSYYLIIYALEENFNIFCYLDKSLVFHFIEIKLDSDKIQQNIFEKIYNNNLIKCSSIVFGRDRKNANISVAK